MATSASGGELKKARDQLKLCGTASCPSIVRDDCTKRLDEIAQAMPAIVFEVKDGSGKDLSAVKITADAQPLVDTIDGTPIEMDPGEQLPTAKFIEQSCHEERLSPVKVGNEASADPPFDDVVGLARWRE